MNELREARVKLDTALSRMEQFIASCRQNTAHEHDVPTEQDGTRATSSTDADGDIAMLNSECARLTSLLDAERERNSKLQQVADELDVQFATMLQEFDQLLEA